VPVRYSIVKDLETRYYGTDPIPFPDSPVPLQNLEVVGLGRLELPTSPLSGVRSSHLSYRPNFVVKTGGAGRDRTGDLLNANQALSQLSYSPLQILAAD
jgi:hypothetical protein